jgi:hypothetical protein
VVNQRYYELYPNWYQPFIRRHTNPLDRTFHAKFQKAMHPLTPHCKEREMEGIEAAIRTNAPLPTIEAAQSKTSEANSRAVP